MAKQKKKFWRTPLEAILCIMLVLLAIGCINVFSASQVAAEDMFSDSKHYLYRYALFSFSGIILMFFLAKIEYHFWIKKIDYIIIFAILLLVYVALNGTMINGARRWIYIGSISFQPSELAKVTVILLSAAALGRKIDTKKHANLFSPACLCVTIMSILIYIQPDLGTAALVFGLAISLFFVCGLPKTQYFLLISSLPIMAVILATRASYRAERILSWLDPWAYADRTGYQAVQSMMAIGSGGFSGVGMGRGVSKFYYLPEAHTDFSFAIFCQEWGFIGAITVIALFSSLTYVLWNAAKHAPDGAGYLIITGTNILVTGQALANIAMVCGLLPVIGVPLPFISYGGTSLLINMGLFGIVLNIIKHKKTIPNSSFQTNKDKKSLHLVKG